jgi:hypothetical protein
LHREFGVQVWAADLWFNPARTSAIRDAGNDGGVSRSRRRPRVAFAEEFSAIVSITIFYYGTDDLYLITWPGS